MKRWIQRSLIGLTGAAIAVGGLTACARHGDGPRWAASAEDSARFRAKAIDRVSSRLDLDAAQRARLEILADKLQAQRAAVRGATDPRDEIKALVAGERFDRSRAQAFVNAKAAAVNTGSPEVISALGDFYDSLNPGQQQKVRDFMERGRRWGSRG
ncbi:MAG: Spy/CpxP family protein refolding chaperone [Burkholderiales bacterium]|nr:Spy/CpxP family protein refolding chaperone [Burkholderiales bacterium]